MRALALVPFAALLACAVSYPPGWPAGKQQPQVVQATKGVMYGTAPVSWDLPDGAQIRIDVAKASVLSGMGAYVADIRFAAAYVDDPDPGIDCTTEPTGPGVPRTRFGCWSRADPAALRFWMAPGVPRLEPGAGRLRVVDRRARAGAAGGRHRPHATAAPVRRPHPAAAGAAAHLVLLTVALAWWEEAASPD